MATAFQTLTLYEFRILVSPQPLDGFIRRYSIALMHGNSFKVIFLVAYSGPQAETVRYKTCVEKVESQLPLAIARAFTDTYLPSGTRVSWCME